jgi:class 3 adenylate cyclase
MTLIDLTAAPDAPAPTSGPVHRAILVVDIEGSTRRTDPVKGALRQILYEILDQSLRASGFAAHHLDELVDRGDGVRALFRPSPKTPKALLLTLLLPWLTHLLREHNVRYPALAMRLRATIHAGEVHHDRHGPYGEAVDLACRLLDTPELRHALRINQNPTALAVSEDIYRTVVRHRYTGIDATAYHPVIHVDLAGQIHRGWLHTWPL